MKKQMLFAEPQELLRGHVSQNQFQPGDLDALLSMRHKKSQRMLIFPKWDWWKSKLLKSSENQGNWKLTRVNSVTGHPSQELQVSSTIFFLTLIFSLQPCFCRFWRDSLFAECDFYSQRLQRSVPVCSRCFCISCVFWECWNDDSCCIVENTSSA